MYLNTLAVTKRCYYRLAERRAWVQLGLGKGMNLADPKNENWRLDCVSQQKGDCSQLD